MNELKAQLDNLEGALYDLRDALIPGTEDRMAAAEAALANIRRIHEIQFLVDDFHPVTWLHRDDVSEHHAIAAERATEDDIRYLASKLGDALMEEFHVDLAELVPYVLEEYIEEDEDEEGL